MKNFAIGVVLASIVFGSQAHSENFNNEIPPYTPPKFQLEELSIIPEPSSPHPLPVKSNTSPQLWTTSEAVWATNNFGLPCTLHSKTIEHTSNPCF